MGFCRRIARAAQSSEYLRLMALVVFTSLIHLQMFAVKPGEVIFLRETPLRSLKFTHRRLFLSAAQCSALE